MIRVVTYCVGWSVGLKVVSGNKYVHSSPLEGFIFGVPSRTIIK